jgi:hypothetical protein
MSKKESKPKQQARMIANLQTTKHYPCKVEKVPSPSKPCGKARRKLKNLNGKD